MSSGSDIGRAFTDFSDSIGLSELTEGAKEMLQPEQINYSGPGEMETQFTQELYRRMMGTGGPSPAEMQMQMGMDQANKNAMALAASQRGINPGLAAALAQRQQGVNQIEANQQAGLMRAQEQLANTGALGGQLQSIRTGQLAADQTNAALAQQNRQMVANVISSAGEAGATVATGGAKQPGMAYGGIAQKPQESFAEVIGKLAATKALGGMVPGKAPVKGDHPKNDVVPAVLSPGEMVVPRTVVAQGPKAVASFAQALLAKGKK